MNKNEMLEKLGTTETEWSSYLAKTSKFITEDLNDGERELHKRIFSKSTLAILPMDAIDAEEGLRAKSVTRGKQRRRQPVLNFC